MKVYICVTKRAAIPLAPCIYNFCHFDDTGSRKATSTRIWVRITDGLIRGLLYLVVYPVQTATTEIRWI